MGTKEGRCGGRWIGARVVGRAGVFGDAVLWFHLSNWTPMVEVKSRRPPCRGDGTWPFQARLKWTSRVMKG